MSPTFACRVRRLLVGRALDPDDRSLFHNLSLAAFLAWVGLGSDGLSSSCYGPAEAFLALGGHSHLSLFVALASTLTIVVICASYSQIIELFPAGGGGYVVASKLLTPATGMVSGCALLIDYALTITLSVASGADAVFSFLPPAWLPLRLPLAVLGVILLSVLNLRGVKESVSVLVPIFLAFVASHALVVVWGLASHLGQLPELAARVAADTAASHSELGLGGLLLLLLRAYSMGAGTYTGLEAVSNGLPILREPRVRTGRRTMAYMAASLSFMVVGLILNFMLFRVVPAPGKTLNAVLFEAVAGQWGGFGTGLVLFTLVSEAAILFVAAQAGFLDGPRVLANMAVDRWFPARFAHLSDRLVAQNGILLMGGGALLLMLLTHGSVELLIVLYSINVFVTFVLSQLGMVRHWWRVRGREARWRRGLALNGLGLLLCGSILVSVIAVKFFEGGWATLLVTGALAGLAVYIRRHYARAGRLVRRLDRLKEAVFLGETDMPDNPGVQPAEQGLDRSARTAVVLVNGFNGLGLHTLFAIQRTFAGDFQNFLFVQVGVVDAGVFKGAAEMEALQAGMLRDLDAYVRFMRGHGYRAEAMAALGTDVVQEIAALAPQIAALYPRSVFFGGQLVFPRETFLNRLLHNHVVFAVQRHLYRLGLPFVIMPIVI